MPGDIVHTRESSVNVLMDGVGFIILKSRPTHRCEKHGPVGQPWDSDTLNIGKQVFCRRCIADLLKDRIGALEEI